MGAENKRKKRNPMLQRHPEKHAKPLLRAQSTTPRERATQRLLLGNLALNEAEIKYAKG